MLLQIFFNRHCSSPIGNKNPYIIQINGGTDMDYYRNLLLRVSTDMKSHEYIPYQPKSDYNIFHILGVSKKEVIMCRFLADLLNPEGQHGCGILFLKSFMQDVLKEYTMSDTLLAHTEIAAEYVIDNERRIDIVIQNPRFFIPIEVKIYAGEQEGQCYDYYQYAKNSWLVYLTRFGNAPSEYSRKEKSGTGILPIDRIQCISWAEDICGWLDKLTTQLTEPVKSTVMQYLDAIHIVADERGRKMMEKNLEILYESPDYFRAGIAIEKSMKSAKITLMRLVFDDLKKEMEKITSKYGLEPEKEFHYFIYEENCNDKFYDGNSSTYPGLNYVVKKAKLCPQNIQMWFRIEVQDNLYAGIALFDTQNGCEVDEITEQMIEQATQYMNEDAVSPAGWWVSWCYPNGKIQDGYYDDVPDFKHMNPCAVNLVDNQNRRAFAKNAVENFEEYILKHLKNL